MKKISSIMLCILIIFSCCSCSQSDKKFSEYSSLNLTEQEKSALRDNGLYLKAAKVYIGGLRFDETDVLEGKSIDDKLSESVSAVPEYVVTTFMSEVFHKTKMCSYYSLNGEQKLSAYGSSDISYSWFNDVSRVKALIVDGKYHKVTDKIYIYNRPVTYMCVYRTEAGDFYKIRDNKSILTHDEYVNMYRELQDEYDKLAEEKNLQEGDIIVGFNERVVDSEDFAKNDITVIRELSLQMKFIIVLIVVLLTKTKFAL